MYSLPDADPLLIHAGSHYAVPGCVAVALAAGLWVVREPENPHLAARHGRPIPGCVVHRSSTPPTPLEVVCQALRCLPPLKALIIAESAVKEELVRLSALRERFPAARERVFLAWWQESAPNQDPSSKRWRAKGAVPAQREPP